jgi:hypothetical protein
VGPKPSEISEDKARISKADRHWIVWQSNARQKLEIILHVPVGDPDPFAGLKQVGTDGQFRLMAVPCSDDTCFSGRAQDNSKERPEGIKYDQVLDGQKADGWIIIQK